MYRPAVLLVYAIVKLTGYSALPLLFPGWLGVWRAAGERRDITERPVEGRIAWHNFYTC